MYTTRSGKEFGRTYASGTRYDSLSAAASGARYALPPTAAAGGYGFSPPLAPAFAGSFRTETLYDKFKQGDLVFGLLEPRGTVIKELERRGFTHTYTNTLNSSVVEMVVNGTPAKMAYGRLSASPEQRAHFDFLYRHRDYLIGEPGKPVPVKVDDPKIGSAYRRACKLLLTSRVLGRTSIAHVVLTGIDWNRVCDKAKSKLGVTDSEMRAAYRDYRRFGKNPNIFFYDESLRPCPAPWERPEIAAEFARYDASKAVKIKFKY